MNPAQCFISLLWCQFVDTNRTTNTENIINQTHRRHIMHIWNLSIFKHVQFSFKFNPLVFIFFLHFFMIVFFISSEVNIQDKNKTCPCLFFSVSHFVRVDSRCQSSHTLFSKFQCTFTLCIILKFSECVLWMYTDKFIGLSSFTKWQTLSFTEQW